MKTVNAAYLARACYNAPEDKDLDRPEAGVSEGHEFVLAKHTDTPSGYQGTIYQNRRTGSYVIAHRGTEFDRQPLRDGLVDAGMVIGRINLQRRDALAFTHTRHRMATVLLGALGLLTACGKEPATATYLQNPDAQDAYTVTLTLHDAPPDVEAVRASVVYRIMDFNCLPPIRNFVGIRRQQVRKALEIRLQRVGTNTFAGTAFADAMRAEDYYGHGACRWHIQWVDASLRCSNTKAVHLSILTKPEEKISTRYAHNQVCDGVGEDISEQMFADVLAADRQNYFSFSLSISKEAGDL